MATKQGSVVVIITGASAGVGRATVCAFARRGARIGLLGDACCNGLGRTWRGGLLGLAAGTAAVLGLRWLAHRGGLPAAGRRAVEGVAPTEAPGAPAAAAEKQTQPV